MLTADATVVVAALVDSGPVGAWAEQILAVQPILAPHLLPAEAANVLRRLESSGELDQGTAALAHRDLVDLPLELQPYEPFSSRIWDLRGAVTAYDAWYVAIAEAFEIPLATLDTRLAAAPGPMCEFRLPG